MMRCTTAALKCVDFVTRMEDSYLCTGEKYSPYPHCNQRDSRG